MIKVDNGHMEVSGKISDIMHDWVNMFCSFVEGTLETAPDDRKEGIAVLLDATAAGIFDETHKMCSKYIDPDRRSMS